MPLSQRDVKGRISSVQNIRKITRAMEMVAAARLRRAEQADLLARIAGGDWDDDTTGELQAAVQGYADDFGHELDEDGQPLEGATAGDPAADGGGTAHATASAGVGSSQADLATSSVPEQEAAPA